MAAKKTASQVILDIFQRESAEVCEQLLGIAKSTLKSRKGTTITPKRTVRVKPLVADDVVA